MITQTITLEQVLNARDRRVEIQNKMLEGAGHADEVCLVCLTMNIAGEIKRTPMTRILFDRGIAEFESCCLDVIGSRVIDEATGSEAFWLVRGDAGKVKGQLEAVEDSFPAARLFDFDVLVTEEQTHTALKLSRKACRSCIVCGGPVTDCARSRRHGLDAVRAATGSLLKEFCAGELAEAAYLSLLDELYTTPKPGLVDLANCGAHTDMDVPLFEKSAACLKPYFHEAALMGMDGCRMEELRMRGLTAEREMFKITGGVNTHKGMIYSMGLLLAGTGRALSECGTCNTGSESCPDICIQNAAGYALEDAEIMMAKSTDNPVTHGGNVMREYGAGGAMQEAASGFPDAVYCEERLNYYISELSATDSGDTDKARRGKAGALAFCDCMARLEDTNLLHRGGPDGLDFARSKARQISEMPDYENRIVELREFDEEMISRNLSPGGSADMLALAFYINRLRKITANV